MKKPDERNHFRVLLAQSLNRTFHIVNEHRLLLKAGNGVVRNLGAKEFAPQDRRQSPDLRSDFEKVANDGQRL